MANTRAGYVYVISNRGAFGPGIIKIGMTRRLNPTDRVRELGDASVPFYFDTHTMIFAKDAVGLERALHKHFADVRLNLINRRTGGPCRRSPRLRSPSPRMPRVI